MNETKIIVPIISKTDKEIIESIKFLDSNYYDLIEWRLDYYENNNTLDLLKQIKTIIKDKELIVTFRTSNEGGNKQINDEDYFDLLVSLINSNLIDYIDVEISRNKNKVNTIVNTAHKNNIKVITSYHNFEITPTIDELLEILNKMKSLKGDILKIALMPNNIEDVNKLQKIKYHFPDNHLLIISMSKLGIDTRINPEKYGSIMSFGSSKKASAPGQINYKELKQVFAQK